MHSVDGWDQFSHICDDLTKSHLDSLGGGMVSTWTYITVW